jgi:hypothetical protein
MNISNKLSKTYLVKIQFTNSVVIKNGKITWKKIVLFLLFTTYSFTLIYGTGSVTHKVYSDNINTRKLL